jgi:hypothetical protein
MTATSKCHPERSEGSAFLVSSSEQDMNAESRKQEHIGRRQKAESRKQKTAVLAFRVLVSSFCFLISALVSPGLRADEFSQTSHYAVRMFSVGTLTLDARTGDIVIEGWDEPRLEVEAEKVVRAPSEAKAKTFYDHVRIDLEGQDKAVRLRTIYPSRKLWRPFRGESKLSVNLRIKMPAEANVKLHCVDGDVRIRGITGHEVLLVNYGDVEIDVPDVYYLRSLDAHAWLGYVQTDLHSTGDQDSAGLHPRLSFWNSFGNQNIIVKVRMGGVWVYSY